VENFHEKFSRSQTEVRTTNQGYLAGPRPVTKWRFDSKATHVLFWLVPIMFVVSAALIFEATGAAFIVGWIILAVSVIITVSFIRKAGRRRL
jgi:hypothetical protein